MSTKSIASITINRDTRQRRDLGDLTDLAASINSIGLINPIAITRENILIAGERRLTACRDILNWSDIPVTYIEDMTEDDLEKIELDENIQRKDLSWQDQVQAVSRFYALSPSLDDAARKLNFTSKYVTSCVRLATAIDEGNTAIANAERISVARNLLERSDARKRAAESEQLARLTKPKPKPFPKGGPIPVTLSADQIKARLAAGQNAFGEAIKDNNPILQPWQQDVIDSLPDPSSPILNTDFREWATDYTGDPFNFIHCDFPYGINADKHNRGASDKFGGYADTEDVYFSLIDTLLLNQHTIISESAHILFWFSMDYYAQTIDLFQDFGWTVLSKPLIWWRSDNSGVLPDPKRGPRQVYETALLLSRDDRPIVRAKSNLIGAPQEKTIHMSQKPLPVLTHFFEMLVDENTSILDPTCGSANALIAADKLRANRCLGLERDPIFAQDAMTNWKEYENE